MNEFFMDMVVILMFISFFEFLFFIESLAKDSLNGLQFFNPISNYEAWNTMNWFGVIFFTI